jgi:hypothetical protein
MAMTEIEEIRIEIFFRKTEEIRIERGKKIERERKSERRRLKCRLSLHKFQCLYKYPCLLFLEKNANERDPGRHSITTAGTKTTTRASSGTPSLGYPG